MDYWRKKVRSVLELEEQLAGGACYPGGEEGRKLLQ